MLPQNRLLDEIVRTPVEQVGAVVGIDDQKESPHRKAGHQGHGNLDGQGQGLVRTDPRDQDVGRRPVEKLQRAAQDSYFATAMTVPEPAFVQ